jgi:hypothetical protein
VQEKKVRCCRRELMVGKGVRCKVEVLEVREKVMLKLSKVNWDFAWVVGWVN